MSNPHSILACNMAALSGEQRARHHANVRRLLASVQEIRELDGGYAFRLPTNPPLVLDALDFISLERRCCPFFSFELEVEQAAAWLRLTGDDGVKPFIVEEFELREMLNRTVEGSL